MTMPLFDIYMRPTPKLRYFHNIFMIHKRGRERFSYFLVLSAFLHITLLGSLFIYRGLGEGPINKVERAADFEAFREALKDLSSMPDNPEEFASMLATVTKEDFAAGFKRVPKLDDRLTSKERAAIHKALLSKSTPHAGNETDSFPESNFSLANIFDEISDLSEFRAPDGSKFMRFGGTDGAAAQYYKLTQKKEQKLQSLRNSGQGNQPIVTSGAVYINSDNGFIKVPSEYYFRQVPYEQILAIGSRLYYFVMGFPSIELPMERASEKPSEGVRDRGISLNETGNQPGLTLVFIRDAKSERGSQDGASPAPISLTTNGINQILNDLNEYPDEKQFEIFRRDYLEKYDADNPLLASLAKDFIYKNLGTVFILTDPFSTGFDFLEGIYYRKLTMDQFLSYCLNNPRTRTSAEILFCLAAYYDFERRSLSRLYEAIGVAEKVLVNPSYQLDVFDLRAKAFVLQQVYKEVEMEIQARGYSGIEAVLQRYRAQQASIYNFLMSMGEDIKDRALYSLGALYWDETRVDMAIKTWKKISPNYSASPFPKIRGFIALDEPGVLEDNIARVIDDESITNRLEMVERMGRFHKWDKGKQKSQG